MLVKCKYCEKEFECSVRRFNYNKKKGYNLCCSKECGYKIRNNNITLNCDKCGIEIIKTPSEFRKTKSGKHYCSKSCAVSMNNTIYKKGENHPNFINGNRSYRTLRLKSGNIECEMCGIEDVRVLQVHHIDNNRKNNKLSNLKLLCANCHLITHHIENQTQGESPHLG